MAEQINSTGYWSCNCMYGSLDSRCCINRTREAEIDRRVEERTKRVKEAFEKVLADHAEALEMLGDL